MKKIVLIFKCNNIIILLYYNITIKGDKLNIFYGTLSNLMNVKNIKRKRFLSYDSTSGDDEDFPGIGVLVGDFFRLSLERTVNFS